MQRVAKYLYVRGRSYTFRRSVPPYARPAFNGVTEYVRSLGDIAEKRALALRAVHEELTDQKIAAAKGRDRAKQRVDDVLRIKHVPDREEIERAVRSWLVETETRSSEQPPRGRQRTDDHVRDLGLIDAEVVRVMRSNTGEAPLMTRWIAEAMIQSHGWSMPPVGPLRSMLEDRVARGQRELVARQRSELTWDDQPQPTHRLFSPEEFARDREVVQAPILRSVSLLDVLDQYFAEQQPSIATIKKWTTALSSLIDHLGHDDAARVTSDDIVGWKNALLAPNSEGERTRGQMTVRHGYLGAVKPVFGWAVANKLLPFNPVLGVKVSVPRRTRTRSEKGYTDAEAKTVLLAARAVDCTSDRSFGAFARRWLPWLCAYTGARVGEMAQLRAGDVAQAHDGIWYVTITPEAGTQKGGFARKVSLHPHLIEQGFVEAIRGRKGPLFYDPSLKKLGSKGNPQHKKVAQRVADWVRSLGITDRELQPNHGWRHRFITIARDIGMDPDVRRAITAHAAKDQHQDYGDVLVRSSYRALIRFPRYEWRPDSDNT
ncbi:Phage integrase family protein [Tsuneonella dongtanensis]|uniref:Phage integrase family protein n=1 Tax=Tsuneonella dongtanensis TaxID=692370 RepID=A0A1B2AC35_9SPHN|nr:hypothetical protein [Tsuneonella dongtanensis]ANY19654.1 Phage integrase family protein [Tsuneonella dongtanensis]